MGRVLWKRLKSARMGKEQKGSTRDLTTAVGRAGSCQPYISSCALCRTIYPHILLNRGPGVSLSMGPTVIHLHDAVPCQNYSAFIQAAHLGVKVWVDPEQELFKCSWHGIAEKTTLDLHFHLRILTCLLFVLCYMLCEKKILFYASPINKGRLPQIGRLLSSQSRLPFHDGDEKSILAWIHCHALVHLLKNPFCPGSS